MDLRFASKLVRREHVDRALDLVQENCSDGFEWLYERTGRREPDSRYVVFDGIRLPTKAFGFLVAQIAGDTDQRSNDMNVNEAAAPLLRNGGVEVGRENRAQSPAQEASRKASYYRALARPEQARFRNALFSAYRECAITGISAPSALEAAHVVEFARSGLNTLANGILLRCDLHSLLDSGDMAIEPTSLIVHFSKTVRADYAEMHQAKVMIPVGGPPASAFHERWERFSRR